MKKEIQKLLKDLEKKNKIKILFAVENGSRAWRMESEDSDYDVRFVFKKELKKYISIEQPNDVINASFDNSFKPCNPEGALIDISGFDIFKILKLLLTSNPTVIEWLNSDIIYHGKQNKVLKHFAINNFNPIALYYHYKSLSKNNYLKYIKTGQHVTGKKYLYTFRGLINSKWVEVKNTIPPIRFTEALEKIDKIIPNSVLKDIKDLIELKKKGFEKDKIKNNYYLDKYIESFLKEEPKIKQKENPKNKEILNKELRNIILSYRKFR